MVEEWKNNYLNNNKSGYYSKEKTLKELYNDVYLDILEFNKSLNISLSEKCYRYVYNIQNILLCENDDCNNIVKFKNATIGYQKTCSNSCSSKINKYKVINTLYNKYNVSHPSLIYKNIKKRIEKRKFHIQNIIGPDAELLDYIWDNNSIRHNDIIKIKCDNCNNIHNIYYKVFEQRVQLNLNWRNCITSINSGISNAEKEILSFIKDNYNGIIIENDRNILNGRELDIYLPELKIAIEYNGLYWHSELYKTKYYHYDKYINCLNKHINLIQIYEDEWLYKRDIIKSRLLNILNKNINKIYARKCIIKELHFSECKYFLEENHLQGKVNSSINLGLYYNNELVSLMTFGRPRKGLKDNKKGNIFELYRFCNKLNTSVIGGASKLFNYFITNFEFDEIYSYSSLEWIGGIYEKLNFKLDNIAKESYWFFSNNKRVSRHNFNKHNLNKLGYNNLLEAKKDLNLLTIYGAGNKKYIYNKKSNSI